VPARNVLDDVLVHHHAVAAQNHGAEADIDLLLTAGTDFVVMELDLETRIDHGLHHLGTDIVHRIVGRNGEVSTLEWRLVTQVHRLFSSTRIPATLLRVDEVVTGMLILVTLNDVEDEELSLGAEEGRVGDPRRLQIRIGALGNCAWVTAIVFARDRVDNIADQRECGHLGEWIHDRRRWIRHDEHVGLVDRLSATDTGPVKTETICEAVFFKLGDRRRECSGKSGAWAINDGGANENDLYVFFGAGFFGAGPVGITVTDYFFPAGAPADFFDYSDDAGVHIIEVSGVLDPGVVSVLGTINLSRPASEETSEQETGRRRSASPRPYVSPQVDRFRREPSSLTG